MAGLDPYSTLTDPVQRILTAAMGSTVDSLDRDPLEILGSAPPLLRLRHRGGGFVNFVISRAASRQSFAINN